MCGIAAFFQTRGQGNPEHIAKLNQALEVLQHRGPDHRQIWNSSDGNVGLGHVRLSIIDLSGGHQPISNREETVHIIANGEIYDFERQRKELQANGYWFRTQSDSEIPLHLYEEYGTQCVNQIRGEYAFVIWDERNQQLLAVRDRFGIKPLFYTVRNDVVYVASEIKALLAMGAPATWDEFAHYQSINLVALGNRTLFEGVYQVPPGHFLLANRHSIEILPYWDLNYPTAVELRKDPREESALIRGFQEELSESVRLRLRADVPVACYLSGGLDSCAILGLAQRHSQQPIQAFTLSFEDDPDYDEIEIAREMAAHAGSNFTPIPVRQADFADHISDAIWHSEIPLSNSHAVGKFLLSRAVRDRGIKVVLTGEVADEILAGYVHHRREMLMYNREGQDPAQVSTMLAELEKANPVSRALLMANHQSTSTESVKRVLGFVPAWIEAAASSEYKVRQLFNLDYLNRLGATDPYLAFLNRFNHQQQLEGRDPVNQSLYLWTKASFANYLLVCLADRMEMAHSLEGRVPFLDHHVVEYMTRVPVEYKIRGMTEKYLLREAVKDVVIDRVYRRQKHPFMAPPMANRPSEKLFQLMQDTLRGPTLLKLPFYDAIKVKDLLDSLPSMNPQDRATFDPTLMRILSACLMQERFGMGA